MFDEQDRQYFYNEFKNNGYEVGSYDDFKKDLNNKEDRDWYYNEAKNMGYDVGTLEDFDKMVLEPAPSTSGGAQQVAASATTQSTTQSASTETKPQVAQPAAKPAAEKPKEDNRSWFTKWMTGSLPEEEKPETADKEPGLIAKALDMIPTGVQTSNGTYQPAPAVPMPVVNENKKQQSQQPTVQQVDAMTGADPVRNVDAIYNKYVGKGDALSETMYDLMASGQAQNQEEAQSMAMEAMNRAANRLAQRTTDEFVSKLGDTVEGVDEAVMNGWHSHAVQDNLKKLASQYGIMNNVAVDENGRYITQTNGYDQFINGMVKPAMVESLVKKYGENYRKTAEDLATRLYSNDEVIQNQLMNQDINAALVDVIGKYVNPSVVDEYNKAQEAGSKAFSEGMEGSQFIPANLRLGTALGAQYEANEAKDPAKVLSGLQNMFGKLYRNPKFLNDMSNAAIKVMQRYGLNGTLSSDPKQFKPMINSVLKNELDQLEIKGMMPKGSAEYIMKTGLGNTIVGKITRKAVQTDYQNWLEDMANQQYQPGFWENVASGALTFAGDAWSYWLPGAAGGKLTKSMLAKAEGRLAGDLMAKGMESRMAARAAKLLIGKSKTEALKSGAVHGAVTFGGQSAISKPIDEVYRTGQFDEKGKVYNPSVGKIIANTLGEVAKQSAVGAIMQGGTIANMVGKGRGLATNILADIGGKVADSGIMTGHQMLERMAQDPNFKPTGKDAAESFLESMANLTAIGLPGMVGKYARFKDAREFNKKFDFTDQDIAELKRFGYDDLRDAFEKVGIGEYAVEGENAQRLDGQLTQKYMNLMNDKSVPEVLKAKMMAVVEGKRPSSFSPVVDSVIVQPMDNGGKVYLETLNKDGGIIERKEYSSLDEAQKADKKLEYEKTLGLASVLEGEFHNEFTQEHLDGLYNQAAQKYNMGEKLTDEDKAAVYLHQNAGAIKDIMDKQQKGIILTEEEQKQVDTYRHFYNSALENSSVMREFVNTFEDSHGVVRGTLRKALESKDKKYAPLVESYLKELYNSIELKREMKQTVDDLYNTAHGNEQKRIEGENPVSSVEGSAGGQEPSVSEGPAPYQDRTNSVPSPSDANSAANVANSAVEVASSEPKVATSDAFVMGQEAYKNGDSGTLKAIDYNSDLATGRLKRAFADSDTMFDLVTKAYNEGRDMEQFVAQRAGNLTPAQKDAISKYVEAMDAKKGAIDALQHADDGYGEALKEQLWPYQMEDGNIVPATLTSGKQVFLKKANEYGGGFVVVPDEQGQPTIKQVSNAEIKEVGTPVPLDEYIESSLAQQKEARAQQFISQFDGSGLKPNDRVAVAMEEGDANIVMVFAGFSEDGKIVLTDGKDNIALTKEEFDTWRKNALDNTINERLDREDGEREMAELKQAEADKQERYKKGIFGYAAGQPDYSDTQTDPKVAAEYLQETAGEDRKALFANIVAEKQALQKRINQLRDHIASNEEWLSINADLDPKNAETRTLANKQMEGQIADLQARFDNWNKIRSAVMTPEEAQAIKADRTQKIADAGVNEGDVAPIEGREVAVLSDEELKKQYPTMDEASDFIASERKRIYRIQSDEVQREIDGVDEVLDRFVNGEIDLEPEQIKELNTTKAQLQARQANLTESAKELKAQADKLKTLYRKENMEARAKAVEDMTPAEQRAIKVENAIKNGNMSQLNAIYDDVRGATDFNDTEPNTLEEYVANNIGRFTLNYEGKEKGGAFSNGIQQETGLGRKDFEKLQILAKEGEGKTVPEFVHSLYDDMPMNLKQMGYTDHDIRSAFLDLIGSAQSYSDIKNYTLNNKVANVEQLMRDVERQEEEMKENGTHSEASFGERLKSAIAETEAEPTEAQKKAGNYKKGHLTFGGYDFTVETPKGVTRSGKDEQGKPWSVTMHDTYGYILGKIGVDGDHIDMFINDAADLDTFDGNVYVVDQVNPETGEFDEHKVMYGYPDEAAATKAYLANYSKDWKGLGKVTAVPKATFDKWLQSSDRKTKPFADYAMIKKDSDALSGGQKDENLPFAQMNMDDLPFHRDVKEVKPSDMTEAQKVAYDAVSTMLKKAGISVKVVSNEDMEKVAEAQDNLNLAMLLNHPEMRFKIKTPEEKKAAENAYNFAKDLRPNKWAQYAVVDMSNPNKMPEYYQKQELARKERTYLNRLMWGNYKVFNLDKSFVDNVAGLTGSFPSEFDPYKIDAQTSKKNELKKQIKETEEAYKSTGQERKEYQNQLMKEYMDEHGLASENDIPDDVWREFDYKAIEKYQDKLDSLFAKYKDLDRQLKAIVQPGVRFLRTYHGTGASFDKFDLSHALEGEGSESFGHGVYVTNSSKIGREYAQRAKQRKMEDLYKNMRYPDGVKGDIFKRRVFGEMVNDVATGGSVASAKEFAKKRVGADVNDIQRTLENLKDREKGTEYEQNLKNRLAEYKEGLKWIDSLDEDYLTQGNANRYDVDIPDDNGSNYLDWEGTIPDSLDKQKVAEDAFKVVSDNQGFNDFKATPLNDFIAHTLKTYVNTTDVAGRVEKLKSDIKDVIENYVADDDVLALNEYLKDATPDDVLATIWYNDLVRDIKDADLGEELYRKLSTYVGDNAASQILSDNGFVGIKYPAGMIHGGAKEGDYNYVIFDENNANIVGNTKFAQGKGVVYGYTDGKEIVLNQEHLNPNTPIHEYQHLWRTAAKEMNPELIAHGDELIKQTQLFADLKEDPNYKHLSDDEICDEAFARLTGEDGAAILEQMAKDAIKENPLDTAKELTIINRLKNWLKKFWYWTLDTFTKWKPEDIKKMTLEDIRNLVLRDLANGVDPRTKVSKSDITKENVELEEVNKTFNQRLDELVENPNQKDKILRLGRSSSFLKAGGIADAEIELDFDKLMRKSKQGYVHEHPFDATDVKDLPMAIANPISVFNNTNGRNDGQVILTELKKENRNFIVAIQTENQNRKGGVVLKVNKIVTLFPKDARGVINWFNQGKATNIDKEKALHFIEALQNHSGTTITDEELKSAANIINSFETTKEKGKKFSLEDPKTLAGVHNISEEKLLKAIKQGGLANPSVAVIDTSKQDHKAYGDISLILPSDKIAKRTGKNAGTWQGDAYTPTYPEVEKQMSNKGAEKSSSDVLSVPKEMQHEVRNGIDRWLNGGDANSGLKYLFLHEKGNAPKMVELQHKYSDKVYNDLKSITAGNFDISSIGKADAQKVLDMYIDSVFDGDRTAYDEKQKYRIARYKKQVAEGVKNPFLLVRAKKALEQYDKYGFYFDKVQEFVRKVESDHRMTGFDTNATLNDVEDYIKTNNLTDEFNTWLEGKEKEYGIKEVIFDGFTPSGNRRYVPNTLENVSKIMKKQGRNGATGAAVSFQNFAARLMPSYGTLKDIRSKKGLLTSDREKFDKFRDKWSNVFFELGNKCQPDSTSAFDSYGMERLSEAAMTSDPQAYLKKEYNVDFSDADTKRLKDMVKAIKEEHPAMYFETKFERPVRFDEFSAAVVPTTTKKEVKEALKNAGVSIFEYDEKSDADRKRAFNEAVSSKEGIRFMFAGEKGAAEADKAEEKTYRMDNLKVAEEMERGKKDAKAIKLATGWERGADGKWRYEMPDAKIKDMKDIGGGHIVKRYEDDMLWNGGKLSNVIDAPGLFEAYPQLKDVRIDTDAIMNDMPSNGEYNPKTNTITIHADELKYMNSILNHEIQHAIQSIEGFATGGNEDSVRSRIEDRMQDIEDAANVAAGTLDEYRNISTRLVRLELARKWKKNPNSFLKSSAMFSAPGYGPFTPKKEAIEIGQQLADTWIDDAKRFVDSRSERLLAGEDKMDEAKVLAKWKNEWHNKYVDWKDFKEEFDQLDKAIKDLSDYQLYHALAGEVESRNVQNRLGMTDEERRNSLAEETEDVNRDEQIVMNVGDTSYSIVKDPETIKKLDKEDTVKVYRAMQVGEDGKLYPPMAAKVKGKFVEPIELGKWEQADERPELADDKGMFTLNKGNGKSLKAAYNPYLHTSRTPLNDQFSEAQNRPNIVTVEVEVPKSELTSGYKADKAKDAVGEVEWKAGIIQGQLTGKRKVVLSRWDKPVRIVPDSEVADVIVNDMFKGKNITMPSNVVTPSLRKELEKRGVPFVETDNRGRIVGGENDGVHYSKVYGKNAQSPILEQKLQKHPDSLMKAGTYFSGGGLVEEGLKGIIDPVVAVEYDRKISGVYRNNFGQHIVTADVRDVDPKELVKHIDGEVEYFHASPVCKNYSQAKSNGGEVELDKETAKSTADFIDAVKPRVVTIENVKGYKDSEAMKIITQALDKNGYKWDADVYNAADFGGYTSRERLIVRAVKDGELPEKPKKQPRKGGWLEAVEDILPTLTVKESGVAPWMDARLKVDGIDWQKVEKPLYVMGSAYADGKIPHAYGDEILPTLRTKSGDVIIMPGGKVLRADGRVLARITGLGDDYLLPKTESLAHTIIGNGIPVQLTKGVIAPLLNKDDLSGRNVLARLGSSIFKNNWDADKQKQVSDRVVNTANKLGGAEATVYTSVDEVPDAYLSDVKNGATGWYDPTTHTVHVYLSNCADANEAERTVLHEKIGHEGMEVLLGGEDEVRKFANFVYNSVAASTRGKILEIANEYDPDWKKHDRMNVGTQEYIARLAEEGPKTAEDFSLWTKIKHYLIKVLKKLGIRVPGLLNDKDLRYYLMKAGKALHVWDEMPQEKQEAMMKQASNAEIKDALSDGAGKGKPRQKKGESMIQYMKRVQEWRKWKNAREDENDPEPPMFYDIDKDEAGKKEWAQLNKDWRERHHLAGEEPTGMPIRMEGEEDGAYMTRIHEYEKWKEAMKDQEDPMPDMFAFEKKKQEEVKRKYEDWLARHELLEQQQADLDLYEGKIYPAETNPKADDLEQQVMQDLAEVTSTDVSKEGAAKTVKHAVIHRRKNMEEASADDAIYINDVKNRIEKMADSGVFDKLLSDYKGKANRAEKLAEAIPYIIEAPRRLRDLAHDLNATGAFDKGHIHIQPADVEAIQPYVADLIAETGKKHTELRDDKEVEVYDAPQAVSDVASKMAQVINDNHQGEEGFVPIDGTDILSEHVLPLVKQQIVPEGIDYKNLSPEMQAALDSIRDWYNYTYDWLKDNRTLKEDTGYNVDYVNHIWDKEKSDKQAYALYVENRQRTKSPNEKKRTISTLMEGISVGLVPKTTDITKMMAYYSRSNIEAWVNKTMLQELSGLNVIERNEDGEVVSTDPLLSSSAPFNLEQYQYFEIPGVGPVWVYNVSPKQVKVKNPITGKEKVLYSEASAGDRFGVVFETYQSSPFWKAFDTLASSAKKLELGFSGFHAGALTEVYMVQNMVEFGPKKAMANFMKYIFADTAKNHELPCFANPQDFQEAASHLVKFGATNDYAAADVQNMFDDLRDAMIKVQEKLKDGNKISGTVAVATMPLKVVTQMLSLINKGMDRALWDFLHDGLKLATYRMRADKTKERAKKKGWTEEELSRALDEDGQFVNDMFGGQHWDVLGASHRTLRYAGRVLLSPDWNASTTRHFLALTGFGSIWNEATFENFKQYYQRLWHKDLMPEDEGRRSRQISALLCYGIGFMVFYEAFANGINAAFRALDEEKERKKAEEIRKTNPSYKSMYELAYGDEGMKWYDYLMRGNSLGQQSKIFMGRYADGTEMYIRHGKQFREVPEYLFNHKGELEFPGPMVQRMIGKANPMVRMTLDDINYLSDFQASHADQEIQRKYGKTIGLLYKDALYWAPFLIPSQENKEFKAVDFFFPSSKGFSPWKAQSYFKDFILSGDMEGVVMTYQSCQRNGIDAEAQIKAAIGSVKALESAEMNDGVTSLQVACQRFDAAKSITEKKKMRQKMKKFLSQSDYKAFTQKEALDMVQGYLNGDEDLKEMEKAESKYLMAAKAEDVTEDWRIQNAWNGTMEAYQEYQRLKDVDKAKANAFKNSKTNKRLFAARKAISAAKRKMNKAKKQMDGTNGAAKMVEIRKTRKELLNTLNGME